MRVASNKLFVIIKCISQKALDAREASKDALKNQKAEAQKEAPKHIKEAPKVHIEAPKVHIKISLKDVLDILTT